ncbi:MAG: hypothetical protein QOG04_2115 [Actinomycetota bacterium]|jgi:hypothetical protein|nr:hypothetical protein [Actinomycetota bacterium]
MTAHNAQPQLPEWESLLVEDALAWAENRQKDEKAKAERKTVELSRQQGYHRLALAIDRPETGRKRQHPGQLSFFPKDPTLFDTTA